MTDAIEGMINDVWNSISMQVADVGEEIFNVQSARKRNCRNPRRGEGRI